MSASIGNGTSTGAAQASASSAVRPQVRSRRVSLKLGSFGLTYSTDQVLWTEAAAAAAASALSADSATRAEANMPVAAVPGLAAPSHDTDAAPQAQTQAAAQESAAAGRSFTLELAAAWRKQVGEKEAVEAGPTYDRTGAAKADTGTEATPEPGQPAQVGQAAGAQSTQAAANASLTQAARPPASRMRQAIGAYLACARNFNAVAPMLTAVA